MTREEAIEILWQYDVNFEPHPAEKVMHAIDMAIEALQAEYEDYEHATLVDIKEPLKVSVVRCKDCRYRKKVGTSYYCELDEFNVKDADFCSWGERKEP
jgi:hypothetical protein